MPNDAITRATQALLRIVSGLLFFCPGALKTFGWFGGMPAGFTLTPLLRTAGWIEVIGGSLLMLGLFSRPVAFICSGEMAVAYFHSHFPRGFFPVQNHGEPAVLLCFIFLFVSAAGPGPLSVDEWLAKRPGVPTPLPA
jgi:putative oxidoreductase